MNLKLSLFGESIEKISKLYESKFTTIFDSLKKGSSEGYDMTGWIEWVNRDHSELINGAEKLRDFWNLKKVKHVLVLGTGGSYIGCRAAIEFVNSKFVEKSFNFIFVPYFSERYLVDLKDFLTQSSEKFAVLVISKSGTTLETSIAFRIFREILYKKEGNNYTDFVAVITDKSKGLLRNLTNKSKFCSFVIEDNIGGRYSTLTAVGLVPMILSGIDAREVLEGAKKAYSDNFNDKLSENSPALYAAIRNYMFLNKGLLSECLCCYDPNLKFCLEKMKQLFAESEGKQGKGLMPIILDFTPDLHSVGQLIQEGKKSFFETNVVVSSSKSELRIEDSSFDDDDNLNWIVGKSLHEINKCAMKGTMDAHVNEAGVINVLIELSSWESRSFGYFYYWLSLAAMYSAYLFEVNPFDQPGVEVYKKRMFELLRR